MYERKARFRGHTEEALPLKSRLEMAPQTPPPAFQPPPLVPVPPPGVSLAEELDKTLMLQLRDRRILVGTMRSFDQFANIVLEGACERIIVGKLTEGTSFLERGVGCLNLHLSPRGHLPLWCCWQSSSAPIQGLPQ